MLSEYLPRGPDESPSIRRLAEERWRKLTSEKSVREKSIFLDVAQSITNDIVGLGNRHRQRETQDKNTAYAQSVIQTDPRFRVPDVIRHASMESLTSAQGLRERLSSALLAQERGGFNSSLAEQKQIDGAYSEAWERRLRDANTSFTATPNGYRAHAPATGTVSTVPIGNRDSHEDDAECSNRKFFDTGYALERREPPLTVDDVFSAEADTAAQRRMRAHLSERVQQQPWRLRHESHGNIDSMERSLMTKAIQNDAFRTTTDGPEPAAFNKFREDSAPAGRGKLRTEKSELESALFGNSRAPDVSHRTRHNDFIVEDGVEEWGEDAGSNTRENHQTNDHHYHRDDGTHRSLATPAAPTYGGIHKNAAKKPLDRFAAAMAASSAGDPVYSGVDRAYRHCEEGSDLKGVSEVEQVRLSSDLSKAMHRYTQDADDDVAGSVDQQMQSFPAPSGDDNAEKPRRMRAVATKTAKVEYSTVDSVGLERFCMAAASSKEESETSESSGRKELSVSVDVPAKKKQHAGTAAVQNATALDAERGRGSDRSAALPERNKYATVPKSGRAGSVLGSLLCGEGALDSFDLTAMKSGDGTDGYNNENCLDDCVDDASDSRYAAERGNEEDDAEMDEDEEEVHIDLSSYATEYEKAGRGHDHHILSTKHTTNKHSHNVYNISNHYPASPRSRNDPAVERGEGEDYSMRRGLADANLHIHNQMPVVINPISGASILNDPQSKHGVIYPTHDPFLLTPQRYTHITAGDAAASAARRRVLQNDPPRSEYMQGNATPPLGYVSAAAVPPAFPTGQPASDLNSTRDGYTLRNSIDLSGLSLQRLREITGSYR